MRARNLFGGIVLSVVVFVGCDPVTTHKITSTIFDGVPSLPPADQYCQDYHEEKLAEEEAVLKTEQDDRTSRKGSSHPPYAAKRCSDCHDKSTQSGLIRPKDKLCFVCHPKIVSGPMAHGPAAVGACLECHEPHSSSFTALLKSDKKNLCSVCHKETRLAESMHVRVTEKEIYCVDCHNPHSGSNAYFLK